MAAKLQGSSLQASIITPETTISEAVKHMNSEVALVCDHQSVLVGTLTDGDIRRAFLNGAALDTPVKSLMSKNPLTAKENSKAKDILKIMLDRSIRHLPIVNERGVPVALELLKDRLQDEDVAEAVIMAGGQGTRLRPLTSDTPKPLLQVGEETILDNVLGHLKDSGIHDVVLTVNYLADKIKKHVGAGDDHGLQVNYVEEKKAMGTAGGLSLLKERPKSSFLLMNADLLTELDYRALMNFHKSNKSKITVCVRRHHVQIPYGVVALGQENKLVQQIDEKPQHDFLVNAGIYILEPEVLDLIPKSKSFDMVSLMNKCIEKNWDVSAFPILEYWKDIGLPHEFDEANTYQKTKNSKKEQWNLFRSVPALDLRMELA